MTPKFQCLMCGSCCTRIRGLLPEEDKDFLKEYAYGKMPLVQLVPLEKMSFPLWDWEAKRFKVWQKEAKVDAKIKESKAVLDLNSNKAIITAYFMDTSVCHFLSDKKCSIHDKKRAYICRLFPFNKGPFLQVGDKPSKKNMFGTCPTLEKIYEKIPDDFNEMVRFLNESFSDEFLNAVQNDIIIEWVNRAIVGLIKTRKIRAAMNYPYEFLLKRITKSEKIDFTDFLVKSRVYTRKEMDNLIKRFDNNMDAKEKISQYLK